MSNTTFLCDHSRQGFTKEAIITMWYCGTLIGFGWTTASIVKSSLHAWTMVDLIEICISTVSNGLIWNSSGWTIKCLKIIVILTQFI